MASITFRGVINKRNQQLTAIVLLVFGLIFLFSTKTNSSIGQRTTENNLAQAHRYLKSKQKKSKHEHDDNNNDTTTTTTTTRIENNKPIIPHNLIFTYQYNIMKTKEPALFYGNVQNTINFYKNAWNNDPEVNVMFFDDIDCRKLILQVEPRLVKFFNNEAHGPFRADICRMAALYIHGGYYFDVDIEVVEPLLLPPTTSFSSPIRKGRSDWFFQAFVATAKGHPIIRNAIESMLMVYKSQLETKLLGPETLRWAFDSTPEEQRGEVLILEEFSLSTRFGAAFYPHVPRHGNGAFGANFVVADPNKRVVYFYSRVMGTSQYAHMTYSDSY